METTTSDQQRRIAGVAALDQPVRRELYRVLVAADGWTSRDQAAAALGVPRSVAAFHLDKLADAGVVDVRFERTTGRQGPGAGRPSKLYRPSGSEVAASIPERHYDLVGSLLATAVVESTRTGAPVRDCVRAAARAAGRRIGEEAAEEVAHEAAHEAADEAADEAAEETGAGAEAAGTARAGAGAGGTARAAANRQAVLDVLVRHGYEPDIGRGDEVALTNCPFDRLAAEHRDLVCGMNLDFLDGLLEGLGATDRLAARLDPEPGYCCVRIAAA